jgi:hypothetical protein
VPSFSDARVRDLLRAARQAGLKPRSDAELLPLLLRLIGAHIPVGKWPTRMTRTQRTEHAREGTQAQAAAADRPAGPPGRAGARGENVMAPQWQDRARRAENLVDAERRRRRESAVPSRPEPAPLLRDALRRQSRLRIPDDEDHDESPGPAAGPGREPA